MLGWLSFLAIVRVSGSGAEAARGPILTLLGCAASALLLTRGRLIRERPLRALLYRSSMFCSIGASYFSLGPLLPALNAKLLDQELLGIDNYLFGNTPAVWLGAIREPRERRVVRILLLFVLRAAGAVHRRRPVVRQRAAPL